MKWLSHSGCFPSAIFFGQNLQDARHFCNSLFTLHIPFWERFDTPFFPCKVLRADSFFIYIINIGIRFICAMYYKGMIAPHEWKMGRHYHERRILWVEDQLAGHLWRLRKIWAEETAAKAGEKSVGMSPGNSVWSLSRYLKVHLLNNHGSPPNAITVYGAIVL